MVSPLVGILVASVLGAEPATRAPWPLWTMRTPPAAEAKLAQGESLVQLEVEPRGEFSALVVRTADGGALRLWNFVGVPFAPVALELNARSVEAIAFSSFDGGLLVASVSRKTPIDWRIDRLTVDVAQKTVKKAASVYATRARIRNLVTALLRYDKKERLYFGLETAAGRFQVMSVRLDGTGAYEVTSPTGTLSALTDEAIRTSNAGMNVQAPTVAKAASAVPVSLEPDGRLLWQVVGGKLMEQAYEFNWGPAKPVLGGGANSEEVATANGYFRERWTKGQPGFELINREHGRAERVATDVMFASRPTIAANGRAFIGEVQTTGGNVLRTFRMPWLAPAIRRIHPKLWSSKGETASLERNGLLLTPTHDAQIYDAYDRLAYVDLGCGSRGGMLQSVFASLDGFFEVLNAGFEAVFVLAERDVSRPALTAVMTEMRRASVAAGQQRLISIADATARILRGDLTQPEGRLIAAEVRARSTLPIRLDGKDVDYADFKPRGPYVASKALAGYFRAFKLINELQLTAEEQAMLAKDAGFVTALAHWIDVQRPFLSGTRRALLFDVAAKVTSVPPACVPERVRHEAPILFPLAWSLDSEALEGTMDRAGVGAGCATVPGRSLPTGLDLLAGLGSPKAKALSASEYARFPALAQAHAIAEGRAASLRSATTFVDSYLRLMQLLATDPGKPEGVSEDRWQRRLLQSALGAWVGLRHTLVLVQEIGAAECDDEREQFEFMEVEPARGAVDPLPAAWRQVGSLLDLLATHAGRQKATKSLAERLREQADVARQFGVMAEKQLRNESLTEQEYGLIERFGGAIEHPYLLFKSALKPPGDEVIPVPEPMTKVVDVQRSALGQVWHAAVGHPLEAVVLLGDRGLLVPANGAVYSYYEVVDGRPIDDRAWRKRLDQAQPPEWIAPMLQGRKARLPPEKRASP